ncbi:septal ring lytic transglycosylase RlpA family protein [Pseudodesulfovibrio piezophilus]|nr:septal ring lytic transglycosylase RlpA family protein [Pseudodesulfovibrio piezophilus]
MTLSSRMTRGGELMRRIIMLLGIALFTTMAGCASINPFQKHVYSTPPGKTDSAVARSYDPKIKPYTVLGRTYYPLKNAAGYDEVGMASWYGEDFHGKKTANGQHYNMYGVSAAHKTLPLGTRVRVTNLANKRSVVLVVNDRGPFVRGRILDLSYGAAKELGTVEQGVARVRITALSSMPAKTRTVARTALKYYSVRVGAFALRDNAERTYKQLLASGYHNANITTIVSKGVRLHVVQAGSFISRDKAEQVQQRLKPEFPTCYIIS